MSDFELLAPWLEECRSPNTRYQYEMRMRIFLEWYGKPLSSFLALSPKDMRHVAVMFQNEAVAGWKPKSRLNAKVYLGRPVPELKPNTIIGVLTALGSFCAFNDKPLRLRGKRMQVQIDLDSHSFSNADLARMFEIGTTQEKALIATLCSTGWEVSSVLGLDAGFIWNHVCRAKENGQKFVYFLDQRKKTGVRRLGVLNPLALEWLGEWLKEWHGQTCFKFRTKEGVSDMLKRLARQGHVHTVGRVHTHSIRAWVISALSHAGFNEWQIKYVVGKSIPVSDATYLRTLQQEVEEKYPLAYEGYLNIYSRSIEDKARLMELQRRVELMEQTLKELSDSPDSPYHREMEKKQKANRGDS
jgi:hypothetical protein